jgi:pimeloyl-ACP methyl ester carboxylesterase
VGDGPTVVFSHGTLMDRRMFRPLLEALSDDYRCIAYDSRARTDQYAEEYDLRDLLEDCRAVLHTHDVDSCVLAGMSMSGFVRCGSPTGTPNVSTVRC